MSPLLVAVNINQDDPAISQVMAADIVLCWGGGGESKQSGGGVDGNSRGGGCYDNSSE